MTQKKNKLTQITAAVIFAMGLLAAVPASADKHEPKKEETHSTEAVMDPSLRKLAQENSQESSRVEQVKKVRREFRPSRYERP